MSQKFLFVSGCPRSGTTVLAHILNWSDAIFVGQERYTLLLNNNTMAFTPELFAARRLCHFQNGDCLYPSFGAMNEYFAWYANSKNFAGLDRMTWIGDKIPNLYAFFEVFNAPAWTGADVTVLHIVRNVLDVAASYHSRKQNPSDGWDEDYLRAIPAWSNSVLCAHALVGRSLPNVRMGIVDYDSIFGGDLQRLLESAQLIYEFVGEQFGPKQVEGMQRIYMSCEHLKTRRQHHDEIRDDVSARVPGDLLAKHRELAEQSITVNHKDIVDKKDVA